MLPATFCVPGIDHLGFRMGRELCYGTDVIQYFIREVNMCNMVDQPE